MSYPFRVQFDRRGRGGRSGPGGKERAGWEGVGREGRSGPGGKEWAGGKERAGWEGVGRRERSGPRQLEKSKRCPVLK